MEHTRAKADELRKAGLFEQAVSEYARVWPDGDIWTGWGYAHCLRKLGRSNEALGIARAVHSLDSTFKFGRSIFAWSLYDVYIRSAAAPDVEVLKAASTIVSLTNDDQAYAPTSAFVITILHVAKLWAGHRDLRVLEWLDRLDVNNLPVSPGKGTDDKGRVKELASRKEQYYSLRTRALERLGRWQDCLDTSMRALSECVPLHHDNEIWFRRRIALAKLELGQANEAVAELQQLADRKPVGFLHTDVASAAWNAGDHGLAFKHALNALTAPQDIGFKLDAVNMVAKVLWERGELEDARTHLALCLAVRQERGWNVPQELAAQATEWAPLRTADSSALLRELRPLWQQWSHESTPQFTGTVTKLLPHGHAGFIRADDGKDYYFDVRDWKARNAKPVELTKVKFTTKTGFDRKRQRSTVCACDIQPITN